MPFYKDKLSPLIFPGTVASDDNNTGNSNGSESLRIDDILYKDRRTPSPVDVGDRTNTASSSSTARSNSRSISHRDSEEVLIPPLQIDPPPVTVEEVS